MTEFKKVLDTTKARTTSSIAPLSRLLVVLVVAMMSLASFTTVLAQQIAKSSAQSHSVARVRAAFTVFPGESFRAPQPWVERTFNNLIYFNEIDKGGHFAAWEQPELLASEIRAAFRSLR